ncbi:ABC transporter substrate-binding protein [Cohnella faecalis]
MNGFTDLMVKKIKGRVDMANKKKNRFSQVGVVAAAVALLGSAWLLREPLADIARGKQANAPASAHEWQDEEIRLSIQYFNKNSFMFEFGNRFAVLHPKVQFDIPPEPESYELEEYKQWLVKNKPDIVQVPLNLLKPLADEGLLLPLDERIQRDGFALEAFHAPVIQTIREAGAGKLYGFAPYFDTAALYYNRTLFERNGVKLPTDRMSWEDVLRLASRFGGRPKTASPYTG